MQKAFPDFRCGKEFDGTERNPGRDRDKRCFSSGGCPGPEF